MAAMARSDDDDELCSGSSRGQMPLKRKRNRKTVSCEGCRTRKTKCDREAPCGSCRTRNEPCEWVKGRPSRVSQPSIADREVGRLLRLVCVLQSRLGMTDAELAALERSLDPPPIKTENVRRQLIFVNLHHLTYPYLRLKTCHHLTLPYLHLSLGAYPTMIVPPFPAYLQPIISILGAVGRVITYLKNHPYRPY